MDLQLRDYQQESVESALAENTIVVLPTGAGKTLVAVKAIDEFRAAAPEKCVVFIVPTKALVKQQAEYCRAHCAKRESVEELCGTEMDGWSEMKWRSTLSKTKLLVGTPEVFRRAVEKGFLPHWETSLIILDECHNAVGNSPMAALMRLLPREEGKGPRIVGLTASFCSGALKNKYQTEKAKIELELLLKSKMICPHVPANPCEAAAAPKEWHRIHFLDQSLEVDFREVVENFVQDLVREVDPFGRVKDLPKIGSRLIHVLCQLGLDAFTHAVRYNLIQQLESQVKVLAQVDSVGAQALADRMRTSLPELRLKLQKFQDPVQSHPRLKAAPAVTDKAQRLMDLLSQAGACARGKGIVFVTQVILTFPLAHLIESKAGRKAQGVYGEMPVSDQNKAVARFRSGEVDILVATDTLQEGIDVADCEWVVRFDAFHTTKAHIQGSGRARSLQARVYYFENDPNLEQDKATLMRRVAGDAGVCASPAIRSFQQECLAKRVKVARGVHPWITEDHQPITFANGLDIVHAWCQKVLLQSFRSEALQLSVPEGEEPMWQIPGPEGPIVIQKADVDKHWGRVQLEDAVDSAVLHPLTGKEKEQRRSFFVLAIWLQQRKCLDEANEPRALPVMEAQRLVSSSSRPLQVSIGNTFPRSKPVPRQGNYVVALKELLDRRFRSKGDNVLYEDQLKDEGWLSVAFVVPESRSFPGSPKASKKAAQNSAAQKAYEALST